MSEKIPKIMLGSAVNEYKGYVLDKWWEGVKALSYPSLEIVLADNSKGDDYAERLSILTYDSNNRFVTIVRDAWCSDFRGRMVTSHNILRQKFLESNCDYLLILDQDVIPPKDVIERLIAHNKDVVVGLYKLYLDSGNLSADAILRNCVSYERGILKDGKLQPAWLEDEKLNTGLIEWTGLFATGCVLLSRKVMEDTIFRHEGTLQDSVYWKDVLAKRYKIYIDTDIMCDHFPSSWSDLLKKDRKEIEKERGETFDRNIELCYPASA
jgi:hypothetical protein